MTKLRAKLLEDIGVAIGRGHARAQILAAASHTFAERGVASTRVEDILVASGLSRRTFYQHFDDKLEVVRAIYELVISQLSTTTLAAAAGGGDLMAAARRSLEAYLEVVRSDRPIVRALIVESLRAESPLFALRARFRADITTAFGMMVRSLTGKSLDPFVGLAIVSALEGLTMELLADDATDDAASRASAVVLGLLELVIGHPDRLPSAC